MIEAKHISCCLISKDPVYPIEIIPTIIRAGFGEILILTNSDSPHRKQELFAKAKHDYLFYQDDDCIAPIDKLLELAEPDIITCAMKPGHLQAYSKSRIALIGWGSIFPKSTIHVLDQYRAKWGEDFIYKRETERIMTWLSYPQKRLDLPITDLPSAYAADRLWRQPKHFEYIQVVEERCQSLGG